MPPLIKPSIVTMEDALRIGEERAIEFIDGEIVEKAAPGFDHGNVQASLTATLIPGYQRKPGGRSPGGWWFGVEIDVRLGGEIFRPDVAGWRRENLPEGARARPVIIRPDWICEVLSPSNARVDRIKKLRKYHQAGVPHYWLLDPSEQSLTVFRHHEAGYIMVLSAERGETVRAEPFDAIELAVGVLFGDDPPEP